MSARNNRPTTSFSFGIALGFDKSERKQIWDAKRHPQYQAFLLKELQKRLNADRVKKG